MRIKRGGATVTAGQKVLPRRMGCDDWRGRVNCDNVIS